MTRGALLFVFAAVLASFCVTAQDDPIDSLQVMWNGVWEDVGLPDPTQLRNCFNTTTAQMTLDFVGNILAEAAANKLIQARATFLNFSKNLPQDTKACVVADPEIQQASAAYHVQGKTYDQLAAIIFTYAVTNFNSVHGDAVALNADFQAGNYYGVGQLGGHVVLDIFNSSSTASGKEIFESIWKLYDHLFN